MRIHLDAEKLQGHNRCYALAPELFDVDEYGQALLLVDDDVPTELQAKARLAAAIPLAADHAASLMDSERQAFSPMLAILSAQHEVQYSRLFRS